MTQPRCSKRIFSTLAFDSRCQRKATVERGGVWYCWQHDPERAAREEAKRKARLDAEWAAKEERCRRITAMAIACRGVPTEVLKRISVAKLLERAE